MPKKILIVDDEPTILKLIASRLQAHGYETITASDGQEGLSRARADKPDLIILDVMMPKMDGYRVAKMLKLDDLYKGIPIIFLTAKVQEQDRETGRLTGAEAYLTKPCDPELLISKVTELIG
ncbi:MAG: response regulator [Candidatus Omnitrophota bacterium]|nr:response regulator [Candidatus Omnitrophota bacterium]